MAATSRERRARAGALVALAALVGGGCAVGDGEGRVTGVVTVADCDLVDARYDLHPTFFGAHAFDAYVDVRVQRGSDFEDRRDGILVSIADTTQVEEELLGLRIPIRDTFGALVRFAFYLNETCPTDFTGLDRPVLMTAESGTIVFESVWAPEADGDGRSMEATFEDVRVRAPDRPDEWRAELDGFFRFIVNRGRPAQRFP